MPIWPLTGLARDARSALKALRRDPLFVIVASGSLALALAVVTSVYGVVDAAIHPPSAVRDPASVVYVANSGSGASAGYSRTVFAELVVARQRVFESVALVDTRPTSYAVESHADYGMTLVVSREFFATTGITPMMGRVLDAGDFTASSAPVAMIGFSAWRKALGAQRRALGRTVSVAGRSYTIVGVMPPDATWRIGADLILPAPPGDRLAGPIVIGRLLDGVSAAQARDQFRGSIDPELTASFGVGRIPFRTNTMEVATLPQAMTDLHKMLLAASGLIVLIGCANLATLMLARGVRRRREYALRFALGARRSSIVQQTLVESLICAMIAAALGIVLAVWFFHLLTYSLTRDVPTLGVVAVSLNGRVFAFATGTAAAAALMFGLIPALRISGSRLNHPLKDGGATVTRRARVRYSPLVIAQVALTLALLMGANLLVQSARALRDRDIGFEPRGLLSINVFAPSERRAAVDVPRARESLMSAIAREPGVRAMATTRYRPAPGQGVAVTLPGGGSRRSYMPSYAQVSANYLATLGVRIVRGRDLLAGDEVAAVGAAVVSRSAARSFWRGESPIGQMLTLGDGGRDVATVRVVGIADDVASAAEAEGVEPSPAIYVAGRDSTARFATILVRTAATAERAMQTRIIHRSRSVLPPYAVAHVTPYLARLDTEVSIRYFIAGTFIAFGTFALGLALFGVFSVRAHDVARRTREFAVRMSLGASRGDIARSVLRDSFVILLAGTGVGAFLAMYAGRQLDPWLYGVFYTDVRALLAAELLLMATTLLASLAPAVRAARSNPVEILRAS